MTFVQFLISTNGRVLRVVVGIVLVLVGFVVQGVGGIVISVIGVVPIVASAMNLCLLGPLFGADLRGNPRRSGAARS